MSNLFSGDLTAGHKVKLLQQLVRLEEGRHERGLVGQLPHLGGVHVARPLDVDGAANLVDAAVSSWVDRTELLI